MEPCGVPEQRGPAVWDASSPAIRDAASWTFHLSADELGALIVAASSVVARSRGAAELSLAAIDDVVITLAATPIASMMQRIAGTLLHGVGVALIRGLPVRELGRARSAAAFLLLSRLMGPLRMQNAAGHILGHVRDHGLASSDPSVRVYQTRERQTFHTDSCDIVGLLCLARARRGGASAVVSAGAIINRLRVSHPAALPLLTGPIATDRRGEVPPGLAPYFTIPVLSLDAETAQLVAVVYQRQYIDSAQRFPDAPRLTPAHVAALDAFDVLTDDPAQQCCMELVPGDIQFVHNHVLLHDRSAFEDDAAAPRHLLRAWVAADGARQLPPCFAERFGSVEVGARGGVGFASAPPNAPLYAACEVLPVPVPEPSVREPSGTAVVGLGHS
jgi:hypothetical protein